MIAFVNLSRFIVTIGDSPAKESRHDGFFLFCIEGFHREWRFLVQIQRVLLAWTMIRGRSGTESFAVLKIE
jgi:hypothetical protein